MRSIHFLSRAGLALLAILLAMASNPTGAQESADQKAAQTLYERLGGVQAIAAVVDDLVDRLLRDPAITGNPKVVEGMKHVTVPGIKFQITALFCELTGGPQKYAGKSMKESHKDLNISEREWDAMAADFKLTLDKFKVPEREQKELFAVVGRTKQDIVRR
jgi:hemoglobin